VATGKFISYLRVSTDRQGRSGLGLEAQRDAVTHYLDGGEWKLVAEYIEVESGKRAARPKLAAALARAKALGATLVLTRNVDLLRSLVASGVDLVFCDLPQVPAGAMGRFLLTQMASVAELEAGLISERTKAALRVARERIATTGQRSHPDVKRLGNPNGARALKGKQVGNKEALAMIKKRAPKSAHRTYERLSPTCVAQGSPACVRLLMNSIAAQFSHPVADSGTLRPWCGCWSVSRLKPQPLHQIAAALNARGISTARGGQWYAKSVSNVLARA
jgi:DNA invertase Pin-like site-specific DNA recombinase